MPPGDLFDSGNRNLVSRRGPANPAQFGGVMKPSKNVASAL